MPFVKAMNAGAGAFDLQVNGWDSVVGAVLYDTFQNRRSRTFTAKFRTNKEFINECITPVEFQAKTESKNEETNRAILYFNEPDDAASIVFD